LAFGDVQVGLKNETAGSETLPAVQQATKA